MSESEQSKNFNNIKVMTESSEGDQEELAKLIKNQNDKKMEKEALDLYYKQKANRPILGLSLWASKICNKTAQNRYKLTSE